MRSKSLTVITALVVIMTSVLWSNPSMVIGAEDYQARDPFYSMTDTNVNRATSTHFQIIWGKNDQTGTVTDAFIQGNLTNLEGIWKTYITDMGYKDPGISINSNASTTKYKTNVYVTRTGLSNSYNFV